MSQETELAIFNNWDSDERDGGWDDLNTVYMDCRALSVIPAEVLPLLRDKDKLEAVKDPQDLLNKAKVLNKDVIHYNQWLHNIHLKHQNRSGDSDNPNQLMEILGIGEEYQEWLMSYQTVVTPTVATILEVFDTNNALTEEPTND